MSKDGNGTISHSEPQRLAQSDIQGRTRGWYHPVGWQGSASSYSGSKCRPPRCFPPHPWEAVLCFDRSIFLFLEKCSAVATTEAVGLLSEDKWSGSNVIRPTVIKLLWGDDRLPCMLAVLRVTGAGFLRCLLAPETSLVNPISEWESAAQQESELVSECADSASFVWAGEELFLRPQ